jgi:hypothetical protein
VPVAERLPWLGLSVRFKKGLRSQSDKGYSFDLVSAENIALVHFLYETDADALAALKRARDVVAKATLIKPLLA